MVKITRKHLRRLIAEAAKKIIVDPEGIATPSDVALASGRDKDRATADAIIAAAAKKPKIAKIGDLMRQGGDFRKQGRELGVGLGLAEPLTPAEETAVDSMGWTAELQDNDDVEHDMDNIINLIKRGEPGMVSLKTFGAGYVKDILPSGDNSSYMRELYHLKKILGCHIQGLQDVANTLGCEIDELGYIPMEKEGDLIPLFGQLSDFLYDSASREVVLDSDGYQTMLLYNYNGIEILLHMPADKSVHYRTLYFAVNKV